MTDLVCQRAADDPPECLALQAVWSVDQRPAAACPRCRSQGAPRRPFSTPGFGAWGPRCRTSAGRSPPASSRPAGGKRPSTNWTQRSGYACWSDSRNGSQTTSIWYRFQMASTSARTRDITPGAIVPGTIRTRSCCRPSTTSLQVGAGFVVMVGHRRTRDHHGGDRSRIHAPHGNAVPFSPSAGATLGRCHSVAERLPSCPLGRLQNVWKFPRSATCRCGYAGRFASSPQKVVCYARAVLWLSRQRHSSSWCSC